MKKAKLETYHVWGAPNTICVRLLYQGRTLVDFTGHTAHKAELTNKARTWAFNQGFTL